MNQHGTYMDNHAFLAANMEVFIRDLYKDRLKQLCEANMEGSPQFKHAKAKYQHWCTISDKMKEECSPSQAKSGSETWNMADMPQMPTTKSNASMR